MASQRKLKAVVKKILPYSDKVRKYILDSEKKLPRFKPGQFLHLAIDQYDPSFNWPESRVFSIANSPTRKDSIEILISKVGKYTERIFSEVKEGDEVWIKLPYGTFNFDDSANRNTVLIAGGTGISPFISFLQYAIDNKLNPTIKLYYGVRNTNLLIIDNLLNEATLKLADFSFKVYVEEMKSNGSGFIDYSRGILPVKAIIQDSLNLSNPVFYLSGPPAMILAFKRELENQGVEKESIKFDSWE